MFAGFLIRLYLTWNKIITRKEGECEVVAVKKNEKIGCKNKSP